LNPLHAQVISQEAVHVERASGVGRVHGAEYVELHPVLLEQSGGGHGSVEGAVAPLVHAVRVVKRPWAIDAQPNQEVVFAEELAPGIVQQYSVCLDGVLDVHTGPCILGCARHRTPVEVEPHEGGLAALPGNRHPAGTLCLDILADISLQQLIRHPEVTAGVELLLGQEEAVLAGEVAGSACGLGQHMEVRRRARRHRRAAQRGLRSGSIRVGR